jgi:hypothetical protein
LHVYPIQREGAIKVSVRALLCDAAISGGAATEVACPSTGAVACPSTRAVACASTGAGPMPSSADATTCPLPTRMTMSPMSQGGLSVLPASFLLRWLQQLLLLLLLCWQRHMV